MVLRWQLKNLTHSPLALCVLRKALSLPASDGALPRHIAWLCFRPSVLGGNKNEWVLAVKKN